MGLKPKTLTDIFGEFVGQPVRVRERTTHVTFEGRPVPVVQPELDEDDHIIGRILQRAQDHGLRAIFNLPGDMHDLTQDAPGDIRVSIAKDNKNGQWHIDRVF